MEWPCVLAAGAFGLGQLAEAEAQRLARLQQLAPPARADDLQAAVDDDLGVALPETTSADSSGSQDVAYAGTEKMLTPAPLHGADAGSPVSYPAPAPPVQTYQAESRGELSEVAVNSCRPGLEFDDSWMDETPEGGFAVLGEYKDDDDVLEKIAEREQAEREQAERQLDEI